mmetsp:Transcript_11147/g.22153  ORF Transcript_11147/g.22153 Transcript_11147/m.22153 type:complete len:114 (-) Transcript_11147:812-1153(-)
MGGGVVGSSPPPSLVFLAPQYCLSGSESGSSYMPWPNTAFSKAEGRRLALYSRILHIACLRDYHIEVLWRSRNHPAMKTADSLAEGHKQNKHTSHLAPTHELRINRTPRAKAA